MSNCKYSVILGFLEKLNDRFSTYGEVRDLAGKFEVASKIEGVQGLELVYPFDFADLSLTKALLNQHNLVCSTVNVNIKAEPKFHLGALTSKDAGIRQEAVAYLKTAIDISAELGTNMITCCPLSDGYYYAFETDYPKAWKLLVDGGARPPLIARRSRSVWNTNSLSRDTRSSSPMPARRWRFAYKPACPTWA